MNHAVTVSGLSKTYILHNQGGIRIPVFDGIELSVSFGECLALTGPSGSGKSTLLRSLYGNAKPQAGRILVAHFEKQVDIRTAPPRTILEVRRRTMGLVSQFLRVIPRVPAREVVAEPMIRKGATRERARDRAEEMLARLGIPKRLWPLSPVTFSGGEQQRINLARGLAPDFPVLLLDEPTSALDPKNREIVVDLIREAKTRGAAVVGIFHDVDTRRSIADREFEMTPWPGN